MKLTVERVLIIVLLVVLVYRSCSQDIDCPPVKTTTVIEEKTTTTVDSKTNAEIKDQQPEKIHVIEMPKKVERVKDPAKLSEAERRQVKEVNRYLDTTKLEGAVIYSEILAEGRVLEHNFKAAIDHRETIITKTIVERPGGLFVSPGIDYSPLGGLEAVETSLTYIKGNIGGSIGAYYNFRRIYQVPDAGSPGLKVKIHIKL